MARYHMKFKRGEHVAFSVNAKERSEPGTADADKTVLASPATATFTVTIGAAPETAPIYEFTTADSQVSLGDAATARFDVLLARADIANLQEGKLYYVDCWITTAATEIIKQREMTLVLKQSVELT